MVQSAGLSFILSLFQPLLFYFLCLQYHLIALYGVIHDVLYPVYVLVLLLPLQLLPQTRHLLLRLAQLRLLLVEVVVYRELPCHR